MRLALIAATAALSLLVAPSVAGAAATSSADTFRQIVFRTQVNTCNGETVALVGEAHFTIKPNADGTSTWHVQLHAEGLGDQGNPYVLNVFRQSVFRSGGGFEDEVDSRELLVSKGSAPNQAGVFHFDAATGELDFEVDCSG